MKAIGNITYKTNLGLMQYNTEFEELTAGIYQVTGMIYVALQTVTKMTPLIRLSK